MCQELPRVPRFRSPGPSGPPVRKENRVRQQHPDLSSEDRSEVAARYAGASWVSSGFDHLLPGLDEMSVLGSMQALR